MHGIFIGLFDAHNLGLTMVGNSNLLSELNKKGVFLQKFCLNEIKKAGWKVREEFPVGLEYSIGKRHEFYESAGDIKASVASPSKDHDMVAIVECKHRFESHWMFLESENPSKSALHLVDVQYHQQADVTRRIEAEEALLYYADIKLSAMNNCLLCTIGREYPEVREDRKHDSIYEACRQVSFATKSSVEETLREIKDLSGWMDLYPTHNVFIPVIVTSADVEVCKYSLEDFVKQKVVKQGSLISTSWLAYEFPLPSYLRFIYRTETPVDFTEMKRQTIFIVNFRHCFDFFELLKRHFD